MTETQANNNSGERAAQKSKKQWQQNDNDLPNGQLTKRRHPESNAYCHSCGFDITTVHTSATCKWKKDGHREDATIDNRMGGSERNCFHHSGGE